MKINELEFSFCDLNGLVSVCVFVWACVCFFITFALIYKCLYLSQLIFLNRCQWPSIITYTYIGRYREPWTDQLEKNLSRNHGLLFGGEASFFPFDFFCSSIRLSIGSFFSAVCFFCSFAFPFGIFKFHSCITLQFIQRHCTIYQTGICTQSHTRHGTLWHDVTAPYTYL